MKNLTILTALALTVTLATTSCTEETTPGDNPTKPAIDTLHVEDTVTTIGTAIASDSMAKRDTDKERR